MLVSSSAFQGYVRVKGAYLMWDRRKSPGIKPGVTSPNSPRPCSRALWPSDVGACLCSGRAATALLASNRRVFAFLLAAGPWDRV